MKLEWRFNGSQQLFIIPEDKKDEQILQLFQGGHKMIKFLTPPATQPTALVLESYSLLTEVENRMKSAAESVSSRLADKLMEEQYQRPTAPEAYHK